MKHFENQFYSSDNKHFVSVKNLEVNSDRMLLIKKNNHYMVVLFSDILNRDDFPNTENLKKFMPRLESGTLFKRDNLTGFNSKDLEGKVKFLIKTLSDKNHPENLENFRNSFYAKNILRPLINGGFDGPEEWSCYKNLGKDKSLKNKTAVNYAFYCYLVDNDMPVGLDFTTLINGAVKKDAFGKYTLNLETPEPKEQKEMLEAVKEFVNLLKSSKKFKENYSNPNILNLEDEDESEIH